MELVDVKPREGRGAFGDVIRVSFPHGWQRRERRPRFSRYRRHIPQMNRFACPQSDLFVWPFPVDAPHGARLRKENDSPTGAFHRATPRLRMDDGLPKAIAS
jgi:hypothetical protein